MVEFVKKTLALKDCTLDATYSDMYDGTNPYLKVGGIVEPKKALLRFQIAEKPTFGDAELKYGELLVHTVIFNKCMLFDEEDKKYLTLMQYVYV